MNSPQSSPHRAASRSLVLAGLSAPVGMVTAIYPPAVDENVWGYPFDQGALIAVSLVLVVAHSLKAHGFVAGLARLEGGGPTLRWSMRAAGLGFVILAICEAISATYFGVPIDSPKAVNLDNGYGVGSMIEAIASIVGGAVIVRKKLLDGFGRWSVLLSGAFMIFIVTPALLMGRGPLAYLALTAWSLFYIWIGRALARAPAQG